MTYWLTWLLYAKDKVYKKQSLKKYVPKAPEGHNQKKMGYLQHCASTKIYYDLPSTKMGLISLNSMLGICVRYKIIIMIVQSLIGPNHFRIPIVCINLPFFRSGHDLVLISRLMGHDLVLISRLMGMIQCQLFFSLSR